jgi:hypothetical protein
VFPNQIDSGEKRDASEMYIQHDKDTKFGGPVVGFLQAGERKRKRLRMRLQFGVDRCRVCAHLSVISELHDGSRVGQISFLLG